MKTIRAKLQTGRHKRQYPENQKKNNKNILTYNVEDIKALEREPFSPPLNLGEGLYVFATNAALRE